MTSANNKNEQQQQQPKGGARSSRRDTEPQPGRVTANRDELIERKKLAGAGRREEPGTAFGSRWTQAERDELQALLDEHGREKAIAEFVAAHPHRTANGAAYQIDKNVKKTTK